MKHFFLIAALCAALTATAQDKTALLQCAEITNGVHCKRAAEPGKQFCKLHNPDTPRCGDDVNSKPGGRTGKGQPCKRRVKVKGERCYQHKFD